MSDHKNEIRDRVRALVKQVLETVPTEGESGVQTSEFVPEHVVVNSLQDKIGKEFDRDESAKTLITEADLRGLEPGSKLRVSSNVRFTPLAQDIVNDLQITLVRKEPRNATVKVRSVALGADHGGYTMKEQLKGFLSDFGINVRDFGTNSEDAVDYP